MSPSLPRRFLVVGLICTLGAAISVAGFSEMSIFLDQSNEFADGPSYGRVDITADSTTGLVTFHVDSYTVADYVSLSSNAGFQTFGFNFTGVSDPVSAWSDWSRPSGWGVHTNSNQDGFGEFDVVLSGNGGNRVESIEFEFKLPDASQAVVDNFIDFSHDSAGQGNVFFAGHYAGFTGTPGSNYIGGSKIVPPQVPIPGAALLGAIGLSVVCGIRRRLA